MREEEQSQGGMDKAKEESVVPSCHFISFQKKWVGKNEKKNSYGHNLSKLYFQSIFLICS